MPQLIFYIVAGLLATSAAAFAEHRMISIGARRLSIDCDGEAGTPTVVLLAGGGRTAKDWAKVQPAVSGFARVCSYDRAGLGESDNAPQKLQSVYEIVDDLHSLLKESGEKGPFILVGHSIAGIYARSFVTRFPREAGGLVLLDSSHEEQVLRFLEINPKWPGLNETRVAPLGFFSRAGERLEWRTELPLIVIGRGKPYPRNEQMTEEQWVALDRIWRGLQEDLAKRSPHGEFRLAETSGHFIHQDQPELVIQAIRDVSQTH